MIIVRLFSYLAPALGIWVCVYMSKVAPKELTTREASFDERGSFSCCCFPLRFSRLSFCSSCYLAFRPSSSSFPLLFFVCLVSHRIDPFRLILFNQSEIFFRWLLFFSSTSKRKGLFDEKFSAVVISALPRLLKGIGGAQMCVCGGFASRNIFVRCVF